MRSLGKNQKKLLIEAARRYLNNSLYHKHQPIMAVWTGHGSMSTYKTVYDGGYMTPTYLHPGCNTWWRLTLKGAAIVKMFIATMTLENIIKEAGW